MNEDAIIEAYKRIIADENVVNWIYRQAELVGEERHEEAVEDL